jgi:hypothetical protein
MNPACEKEGKNLPNQNETSRRSIIAIAAVDALQHDRRHGSAPVPNFAEHASRWRVVMRKEKFAFLD